MSQKIKDIIAASITVKQQILQDEAIITTVNDCVTKFFRDGQCRSTFLNDPFPEFFLLTMILK